MKFTHILFPYDFSARADAVAPLVRSMAAQFGAKVTLFSVVPPRLEVPPKEAWPRGGDSHDEDWKRTLRSQLDQSLVSELSGVNVNRVVEVGDPATRIRAFAEGHGVDLVMMPTRGQGAFRAFLLGSVTSKILHDVKCAVWTASHAEEALRPGVPKTVLGVIDATERAAELCHYAIDFAAATGASLRLLHVAPIVPDLGDMESERTLRERIRAVTEKRLQAALGRTTIAAALDVMAGDVGPCVAEYARCEKADLVIANRGAISEPLGRLRAHTADIVTQSPCPVLNI
jgi:nucleotide-binding universal stress UspA family protein